MDDLIFVNILLLLQLAQPAAADSLEIEASVALGGHVGRGGFTEINVKAYSATGGLLTLHTAGGAPDAISELQLPAGELTHIRIPFGVADAGGDATLQPALNGKPSREVPLNIIHHQRPPALLAGPMATRSLSKLSNARAINGEALPHYAPVYRQVDALAIDGATLAALDEAQLRSLLQFAGDCGRLLLLDVTPAVEQVFASRAACSGRYIASVASDANVKTTFDKIMREPRAAPVTDLQLRRLLTTIEGEVFDLRSLAWFWGGFLLVLILLAARVRTRGAALGFSVIGSLLVLAIWPAGSSRAYVAWAEAGTNDRVARYRALERIHAPRSATHVVPLGGFGAFAAGIRGADVALQWGAGQADSQLIWQAAPFAQLEKVTFGSFTIDAALQLATAADGVVVCNNGNGTSRPAYLRWNNELFTIPPLSPDATWHSAEHAAINGGSRNNAEIRLLSVRSRQHSTALLQALPVSAGGAEDRAWLMRYAADSDGEAVCAR